MKDYQRMEEMKMEYEQIPVPQELRGRVQESLAWAKEKEHKKTEILQETGQNCRDSGSRNGGHQ